MNTIDQYKQAINILEDLKEGARAKYDPVSMALYVQCVEKIEEYLGDIDLIARNEAIKIIEEKLKLII